MLVIFYRPLNLLAKLSPHEREYYFYSNDFNMIEAGLTIYSFTMLYGIDNDYWSDGTVGFRTNDTETISPQKTYEANLLINNVGNFSFAINYLGNLLNPNDHEQVSNNIQYSRQNITILYDIYKTTDNEGTYIHGLSFCYSKFKYYNSKTNFTFHDINTNLDYNHDYRIKTSEQIFSLLYYYDGAHNKYVSIFSRRIGPQIFLSNINFPFIIYDVNKNYTIQSMEGKIKTFGLALGLTQYSYIDWFILHLDADIYFGFGRLVTNSFSTKATNYYFKGEIGAGFRWNCYKFIISGYIIHSTVSFMPTNRSYKSGEPGMASITAGEKGISLSNTFIF